MQPLKQGTGIGFWAAAQHFTATGARTYQWITEGEAANLEDAINAGSHQIETLVSGDSSGNTAVLTKIDAEMLTSDTE
jgi:hypothetical protein